MRNNTIFILIVFLLSIIVFIKSISYLISYIRNGYSKDIFTIIAFLFIHILSGSAIYFIFIEYGLNGILK